MAELVAPGVWWLHGTRGSNVYLLEARDGQLALVDTGFGANVEAIVSELASIGNGRPLAAILLTHQHFDHVGSALAVQKRTGARVIAGRADCARTSDDRWVIDVHTGRSHVARAVLRGLLRRQAAAVPVNLALEGKLEVLPGVIALPAPGHTPGSYCFVSKAARAIFVGDLVISHGQRLSRPLAQSHADAEQYEQTLHSFASLEMAVGCPGHGQPVLEGFGDALMTLSETLPRPPSMRGLRDRMLKLHSFTLGMYRRRTPPR